jgi:dipeptidyl aminopeptidase/acylaminoacyl peptidase
VAALPVSFRGAAQGLLAHFSSSAGAVLSYLRGGTAAVELVWFDRAGRRLSIVGEPAEYSNPALSPDEKRLAISQVDSKLGTRDIWIFDLDRGGPNKFTFDRGDDMNPVWSPDGERIAFSSSRKGRRDLYVKNASGAGDEQVLFESGDPKSMMDWSADGRHVLFTGFVLPLDGERTPVRLPPGVTNPKVSPDGRWLAYYSNESGRLEIYVQSFPALLAGRSAGKWLISMAGGWQPEWGRDSREIFYVGLDGTLMAASVTASGPAFETTPPKPLFSVRLDPAARRAHYQPAANGQRFLVAQLLEQETANRLTVVVNWSAGLTR